MKFKKLLSGLMVGAGMLFTTQAQDWNGGGSTSADLYRDGRVGIGLTGVPSYQLELDNGDFNILNGNGIRFDGTYGLRLVSPSSSDFILGNGGMIGVGMTPSFKLDVAGDINTLVSYRMLGNEVISISGSDYILGNSGGNFGVGISPAYKLDVGGDININSGVFRFGGNEAFTLTGSDYILGNSGGSFGIGITPTYKLDVGGDININSGVFRFGGNEAFTLSGSNYILGNSGGNFGVGITPAYKLDVDGDINLPSASAYKIDGIDFLKYKPTTNTILLGTYAGLSHTTGYDNIFVGKAAGENVFIGYKNIMIGNDAGAIAAYNIDNNIFIGDSAGYDEISGRNVFIGNHTGVGMTGGGDNTIVGDRAGGYAQGGNSMFGASVGMTCTTTLSSFFGAVAGANSNGLANVMMGYSSGYYYDGDSTVLIGLGTGNSCDGDRNVFIGNRASSIPGVAINDAIALGASSYVTSSNSTVLGNLTNSYVGILVSNPTYNLEVNGTTYSPGGVWTASDKRYKKSIDSFKGGMVLINQLKPMQYEYRDDVYQPQEKGDTAKPTRMNFPKGQQFGFLAQDLEKVLPNAVMTRKDGYKAVNYQNLIPVMVEGMQEQDKTMVEEKKKMAALEADVESMKEQNKLLLQAIEDLKAQMGVAKSSDVSKTSDNKAYLQQNTPNPFSENTVLKYFVPTDVSNAKIIIRSSQALEMLTFDITHKGFGNIIISGNTLTTGAYTCELYVAGQLVDLKKMLLVK